jgi:branched-chain amino acid transport system substrate-binding protein
LVVRDDEHDPTKTVAAYRQLIERQGVVAMVGATNSASMLAVTPLINDQLKIPTICPHTDANDIITNQAAKEGRDSYLFRLGMFSAGQADFLIDNVVRNWLQRLLCSHGSVVGGRRTARISRRYPNSV